MEDCKMLVTVDESAGCLERLVLLNLSYCKNLKKLRQKINMLKSLEKLNLSGCSELVEFPEGFDKLDSLKVLDLSEVDLNRLSFGASEAKRLVYPRKSPLFYFLKSLSEITLRSCNLSEEAVSFDFSVFRCLRSLVLSCNPFRNLPSSIDGLALLQELQLYNCKRLQFIHGLPNRLLKLMVTGCPYLKMIPKFENIMENIMPHYSDGCERLLEAEGIFKLEPIGNADPTVIQNLGLCKSEALEHIELDFSCTLRYT